MSFGAGYRGTVRGAVQTAYTDQPGVASPGMLAFASDLNYCDALFVGEANGVAAGIGVIATALTDAISLQRPNQAVSLPADDSALAALVGIVVFDEAMQSDENGTPGWAHGRVARVAKRGRAGTRIYVKVEDNVAIGDPVEWVVKSGTNPIRTKGSFTGTAQAGTTTLPLTRTVTDAKWVTPASAGGVAILEFL